MAMNKFTSETEDQNQKKGGSGSLQEDLMCSDFLNIFLSLQDRVDLLEQFLRGITFLSQGQPGTLTHFSVIMTLTTKQKFLLGVLAS